MKHIVIRSRRFSANEFLGVLVLLVLLGCSQKDVNVSVADGEPLTCTVYCSDIDVGTSGARLHLARPGASLGELQLDWTVHKGGFQEGAFLTFESMKAGQAFTTKHATVRNAMTNSATNLALVNVVNSSDQGMDVRVEGLEPGLNYRWRVLRRAGSKSKSALTTSCIAPVCPVDPIGSNENGTASGQSNPRK